MFMSYIPKGPALSLIRLKPPSTTIEPVSLQAIKITGAYSSLLSIVNLRDYGIPLANPLIKTCSDPGSECLTAAFQKGGPTMEPQAMQLPIYVKILALIGAVLVIFILAAWEQVTKGIASAARAVVRSVRSRLTPKKPVLPKPV
jgi:hypothetical protein